MSRLCWDFLTFCTFPKGACCHSKAGLSPNPLSLSPAPRGGVSLQHMEADEDSPSVTPGHLGFRGMPRSFLVKLVVTVVARSVCTGEFSQLMGGCILPCTLFGGDAGGGYSHQTGPSQPNPMVVGARASPWGLTSTKIWLDAAML